MGVHLMVMLTRLSTGQGNIYFRHLKKSLFMGFLTDFEFYIFADISTYQTINCPY